MVFHGPFVIPVNFNCWDASPGKAWHDSKEKVVTRFYSHALAVFIREDTVACFDNNV